MTTDELTLEVGGRSYDGWQDIRVTRGMERCPNDFALRMTERDPDGTNGVPIVPGESILVKIGDDIVITGYVDQQAISISAGKHELRLTGRGKCQDLVDCAAEWPSNQIMGASAFAIAERLAKPYGINVIATGNKGKAIQQLNLMWGEKAFEVIERICRFSGLLAYENTGGNLIISEIGTCKAASGFIEGQNVQSAELNFRVDQRFSKYIVRRLSMDTLRESGTGGDIVDVLYDKGIKRHRMHYIIAESGNGTGRDIAVERGQYEVSRRFGRSATLSLTVDSWRDDDGKLWEPNTLVPIHLPSLKLHNKEWCISDVTYQRNANGTTANLSIMPPEAFTPEPLELVPFLRELEGINVRKSD